MKVKIQNWHAVASWTWTTEDDVCGICHMPLDGCAPGASGPGDDSPVVWGRVRRRTQHSNFSDFFLCRSMHSRLASLLFSCTVLALLPPHVHHDVAAQQEHVPNLPAQVGVRLRAQAGARDARRTPRRRGIYGGRHRRASS